MKPSHPLTLTSSPIISTLEVVAGVHLVWLECPKIAAAARPGQFVMVRCGRDTYLRRPLSVHRVDGSRIALLFNTVGRGTLWLAERRKGESLDIFGPLGRGYTINRDAHNLLLVAGGMGIAPLRFLADEALRQNKKVTILTGAPSADCLLPVSPPDGLFAEGVPPFSLYVVTATDDGSEGFRGPVTGLITAYLDKADQVFACGPVGMYRIMAQMPELKNSPVQLSLEIMMGCGMGVCYSCTIKTKSGLKQVCHDGPVFAMSELEGIDWDRLCGV